MRIAIIGTRGIPAKYGGFETFAEEIATRMAERGHSVVVYGRRAYYSESERKRFYKGVRTIYLNALGIRQAETFSSGLMSVLHLLLTGKSEAAIICNCANGFHIPLLKLAGVNVLINVDGLEWQRDKWGRLSKMMHRLAERITVWTGRRNIVVDSAAIGDYYRTRYGIAPHFISYGAPVLPRPAGGDVPPALRRIGVEPGGYLLQITRFVPENNVLPIVEAFRRSPLQKKLVLVGGDTARTPYVRRIADLAASDARIVLPGFIYDSDDIAALLTHAWAYIHGNEVGGTNPALLQAMGAGNAVLAADTVFNREVLGPDGMFFQKNAADVREKLARMAQLSKNDMLEMGRRAQTRVAARYNWDDVTDKYLRELQAE
jgi:glycosyltransferase involved in cell wall biosynthesis